MSQSADPRSHATPALRLIGSLVAGLILAGAAGAMLGEQYLLQGDGIRWLALAGGVGLGAVVAWVMNRIWAHDPPLWMVAVAAFVGMTGQAVAVRVETGGYAWPMQGWAAVVLAGVAGAYGIYSANRVAAQERAKK